MLEVPLEVPVGNELFHTFSDFNQYKGMEDAFPISGITVLVYF